MGKALRKKEYAGRAGVADCRYIQLYQAPCLRQIAVRGQIPVALFL
jgi:hypothetical protein